MELACFESPFPFDQVEELFPLPSLSSLDIPVPTLPFSSSMEKSSDNNVSQKPKNGRRRKSPNNTTSDDAGCYNNPNEHKKKKIIHRDVERQRRQEMSTLYANLRSLLPLEYLKGKRSICDHMQETVKYIQHTQANIQKLSNKRDELKRLSGHDDAASDTATIETLNSSKRDSVSVAVNQKQGGVQVVLHTPTHHGLPLSTILQALIAQKFDILSCISTKVNDSFLHTIDSQAAALTNVDVSELQHKLTNL
ncbi:transcription factor bHLH120-like [Momordica charantia]|uniref:Transcription factor bHLH120-like n=1 Tax=Momordica charantia TaxID=3673 RepID=A0A6J1DZB0_MOMCH|nr:transcription factor bHLH120-like [Momordica charantia]